MDFPRSQFSPGGVRVLSSTSVTLIYNSYGFSPGEMCAFSPGEMCAFELDFLRVSFPAGESCAEERDYIKSTWLAGSPVCAWTVTGSLLFGSPHRCVRGCFHSTFLCLLRFDGLDVVQWNTNVHQHGIHAHLLVTINSRFTPDIITSVLIDTGSGSSFCGACVIAGRDISLDTTGRSFAGVDSIWFLLGISRGLCLSWFTSPTVWWREVMSVPDSRFIRVVTPDDHFNIGFHEVLLHDMEDEDLSFVALSELGCLRLDWPKTLFVFMSRYQHDLERMRKECRERFGCTQSGNCTHCGKYIQQNLGKHIALYHMELAQLQ